MAGAPSEDLPFSTRSTRIYRILGYVIPFEVLPEYQVMQNQNQIVLILAVLPLRELDAHQFGFSFGLALIIY
jgi:hypothetical protein